MKKILFCLVAFLYCFGLFSQNNDLEIVKKSADSGDAISMYKLASYYSAGKGVSKDLRLAQIYFQKAVDAGCFDACCSLGVSYAEGWNSTPDMTKAISCWEKGSLNGNGASTYNLAMVYYSDKSYQNYDRSKELFEKAGEQGVGQGYYMLGIINSQKENYSRAYEYFEKAAKGGCIDGFNDMAYCYAYGRGVDKNIDMAFYIINYAISIAPNEPNYLDSKGEFCLLEGNDALALYTWNQLKTIDPQFALESESSFCLKMKNFSLYKPSEEDWTIINNAEKAYSDKDYEKAVTLFTKAYQNGENAIAPMRLSEIYQNRNGEYISDFKKAFFWCKIASEKGNLSLAQTQLASFYYMGIGTDQNLIRSLEWYRIAATQGEIEAMYCVGLAYQEGEGTIRDYKEAMKWYQKAAEKNHGGAANNLGYLYAEGLGVEKDIQKAGYWYKIGAAAGDPTAQCTIGIWYINGIGGFPINKKEGEKWLRASASQGNTMAQVELNKLK